MSPEYTTNGMQQYPILGGAGGYVPALFGHIKDRLDKLEGLFNSTGNIVKQYGKKEDLPETGELNTLYFILNTGNIFFWNGDKYQSTGGTFEFGDQKGQAFPGPRGLAVENKVREIEGKIPEFTEEQQAALNSGINADLVAKIGTVAGDWQPKLTDAQMNAVNSGINADLVAKIGTVAGDWQPKLTDAQMNAVNSGVTTTTVSTVSSLDTRVTLLERGSSSGGGGGSNPDVTGLTNRMTTAEGKIANLETTVNNAQDVLESGLTKRSLEDINRRLAIAASNQNMIVEVKSNVRTIEEKLPTMQETIDRNSVSVDGLYDSVDSLTTKINEVPNTVNDTVKKEVAESLKTIQGSIDSLDAAVGDPDGSSGSLTFRIGQLENQTKNIFTPTTDQLNAMNSGITVEGLGEIKTQIEGIFTPTTNQLDAMNSGITGTLVAKIDAKIDDVKPTDSVLSATSENPVQNKVIKAELDKKANKDDILSGVAVDSALSATSENPVQNKVVKAELDKKYVSPGFDETPTAGSSKLVTSGAVATYVDDMAMYLEDTAKVYPYYAGTPVEFPVESTTAESATITLKVYNHSHNIPVFDTHNGTSALDLTNYVKAGGTVKFKIKVYQDPPNESTAIETIDFTIGFMKAPSPAYNLAFTGLYDSKGTTKIRDIVSANTEATGTLKGDSSYGTFLVFSDIANQMSISGQGSYTPIPFTLVNKFDVTLIGSE